MSLGYDFICLNTGRRKKALITAFCKHGASMRWITIPGLSFFGFPETNAIAAQAAQTAINKPINPVGFWLKERFLRLQYNWYRRMFSQNPGKILCVWNGLKGQRQTAVHAAKQAGLQVLHFELGPLPKTMTVDPKGVNFHNSLTRTAEPYISWMKSSGIDKNAWRTRSKAVKARKPEVEPTTETLAVIPEGPFVFVPLQVPGDSQLVQFGGLYRDVPSAVREIVDCADALPEGWKIVLKHHPSAGDRFDDLVSHDARAVIQFADQCDTFDLVRGSEAVFTINSSVGLESFYFDKPVRALGQAFLNFDPISTSVPNHGDLRLAFANAAGLAFDAEARNAFMSYLTEVYFPQLLLDESGGYKISAEDFDRKMNTIMSTNLIKN